MSVGATTVAVFRHLEVARPDLTHTQRSDLAVQIIRDGGAQLDRDATLALTDDAKALIGAPPADWTPPRPQRPAPRTLDAIRADLASVRGTDDRSRARRSVLRDELGRTTMAAAPSSTPISDDMAADLAATRGPTAAAERAARARVREAHAARALDAKKETK